MSVQNGEVTLTGLVDRREDKRALEDLAEDVFGVEEVQNHVRVRREPRDEERGERRGESRTFTPADRDQPQRH